MNIDDEIREPTPQEIEALLRRVEDRRGSWSSEERDDMRRGTDEQFERVFRDPTRWSYVVRDPLGNLVAWGKSRSRADCLRYGAELAEEYALEQCEPDDNDRVIYPRKLDGHWRFMLWPPQTRGEDKHG